MRFNTLAILGGGLMLALVPAGAASAAEIDCIAESTPANVRPAVLDIATKIVIDSDSIPDGERQISIRLDPQLKSCTARHGWSAAKGKSAMDYSIALLLREALRKQLATHNVSLAAVDRVVAANPKLFRSTPGSEQASEADRVKVLADSRAAGIAVDKPEVLDALLTYFGGVAVTHQISLEFDAAS